MLGRLRTIAVLAQKGGVGKSTTALNVGAEAARRGLRVLAIDADKQADLSRYAGLTVGSGRGFPAVLLEGGSLDPTAQIARTRHDGLDVLSASQQLTEVDEIIRVAYDQGPLLLTRMLEHVRDVYDLAVIDVGHSQELLLNVVAVADAVLVPSPANFPDADHIAEAIDIVLSIRADLGMPRVELVGRSVVSLWRRAHNAAGDQWVIDELTRVYGDRLCPVIIPNSSHVSEANKLRLTLREFRDLYGRRRDRALTTLVDAYATLTDYLLARLPAPETAAA